MGLHLVRLWGPSIEVQYMIQKTASYRQEDRDEDGI